MTQTETTPSMPSAMDAPEELRNLSMAHLNTTTPESTLRLVEAIDIQLTGTCAIVTMANGARKYLTVAELTALLEQQVSNDSASTGSVEVYPHGTYLVERTTSSIKIGTYYAEGIRPLKYTRGNYKAIVAPNIMIFHTLKKTGPGEYSMADTRYFITKSTLGNLPKKIFTGRDSDAGVSGMPFSNCYEDHRMCFGDNCMPMRVTENNFSVLHWYYQFLWETPFNDDLGLRFVKDPPSVSSWYAHLAELAKEGKPFPYEKVIGL